MSIFAVHYNYTSNAKHLSCKQSAAMRLQTAVFGMSSRVYRTNVFSSTIFAAP